MVKGARQCSRVCRLTLWAVAVARLQILYYGLLVQSLCSGGRVLYWARRSNQVVDGFMTLGFGRCAGWPFERPLDMERGRMTTDNSYNCVCVIFLSFSSRVPFRISFCFHLHSVR